MELIYEIMLYNIMLEYGFEFLLATMLGCPTEKLGRGILSRPSICPYKFYFFSDNSLIYVIGTHIIIYNIARIRYKMFGPYD